MTLSPERLLFTNEAKKFLDSLHKEFSSRISTLIKERQKYYLAFDRGQLPDFSQSDESIQIRTSTWTANKCPKDILDRRIEITGPPSRKMVINALNSGANVFMADFEDSNSPTWNNCLEGQINLYDAVRKTIDYTDSNNGKEYKLNNQTAVLFVRPRGLHLLEKNYDVGGESIFASLFDFGLYFFHNYEELIKRGTSPYFYLPKLEHSSEAKLWADIFEFSENHFNLPRGTIKATVLIETLPAVFQMDEIIYELKNHSVGLNCGRWDYIFSFIKCFKNKKNYILPDRSQITMNTHFMKSYSHLLIQTCHSRGVHAMGGMAAQIPIKNDPEANHIAMEKVRADKYREVQDGHDGTWVAHPALVDVAKEIFDKHMPQPNQIDYKPILNRKITSRDLLSVPVGTCTEEMLKNNISILFQYINAWINGNGCVPINYLMEDVATAEISRAQIWQWLQYKIWLTNGKQLTHSYFLQIFNEELQKFQNNDKIQITTTLFIELCTSKKFIDFLTLKCYDTLNWREN